MKCNILSVSHTQSHTSSSFRACQTASQRSCSYAPMATTGHKAISAEELEVATVFVLQCVLDAHPWQKCNKLFLHKILEKKTRRIRKGHTVEHGLAGQKRGAAAWLAAKRQLRQLRNAYKNRAPLARLHIYHFKLPAAEALPAVAAGLCGAAHTHTHLQTLVLHTIAQILKQKPRMDCQHFNLRLGNQREAAPAAAPAALIEALHANIHEQLHQVCLQYNIYFCIDVCMSVYLADTGLSADICSNHCSHLCATFALAILRFQHFAHFLCVTSLLLLLIQWGTKHK